MSSFRSNEESQLKLNLGSLFMPDIKLDDHPAKPETATFSTIAEFPEVEDLADAVMVVSNEDLLPTL